MLSISPGSGRQLCGLVDWAVRQPRQDRAQVGGDDDYRDGGIRYIKSVEFDIVEETRVIGAGRLFRINADLVYDNDESIHLICDYMQNTMDCAEAVYDLDTDGFSPKVERLFDYAPPTSNVLLIDRIEIEAAHRGRMIGLIVSLSSSGDMGRAVPWLRSSRSLSNMKGRLPARKKPSNGIAKSSFAIIHGWGSSDFYAISLADELPTERGLLRGPKTKVS